MSEERVDQIKAMRDCLITFHVMSAVRNEDGSKMSDPFKFLNCESFLRAYAKSLYDQHMEGVKNDINNT